MLRIIKLRIQQQLQFTVYFSLQSLVNHTGNRATKYPTSEMKYLTGKKNQKILIQWLL